MRVKRLLLAAIVPLLIGADTTFGIAGRVVGASGKHAVHVALWTADNFLGTPTKELRTCTLDGAP